MGWSRGYDLNWKRDIGYGVPSVCDSPKCNQLIDRGLAYVCGGQPYGGESGCGLFFCSKHLYFHIHKGTFTCSRCVNYKPPYKPKPDVEEWITWKAENDRD